MFLNNCNGNQLIQAGVIADNVHVISYGKEKPFRSEDSEQCWQKNRHAHFVFQHKVFVRYNTQRSYDVRKHVSQTQFLKEKLQ